MKPFPQYLPLESLAIFSDDEIREYEARLTQEIAEWRAEYAAKEAEMTADVERRVAIALSAFPEPIPGLGDTIRDVIKTSLGWGPKEPEVVWNVPPESHKTGRHYGNDPITLVGKTIQPSIVPTVRRRQRILLKQAREKLEGRMREVEELQEWIGKLKKGLTSGV